MASNDAPAPAPAPAKPGVAKTLVLNFANVLADVAKLRDKKLAVTVGGVVALIAARAFGLPVTVDEAAGFLGLLGLIAAALEKKS